MIAITGATGNLGRLIITHVLAEENAPEMVAVVRDLQKAEDLTEQGVALRYGDYTDRASLVQAFAGVDTLMFISNADVMNRTVEHDNVVGAAVEAGVGRIVYTSYVGAGTEPMLGPGHLATEIAIKDSGIPFTILRANFYMDAYVPNVHKAMALGVHRSPSGDTGAALISRNDIARAAAAVLSSTAANSTHEGKMYILSGPEVVTPAVYAAAASQLSGRDVVVETISWDEQAADYKAAGIPDGVVDFLITLDRLVASGVLAVMSTDVEDLTGEAPVNLVTLAM